MSDLVRNPEDRFSRAAAHMIVSCEKHLHMGIKIPSDQHCYFCPENIVSYFLILNLETLIILRQRRAYSASEIILIN